MDNALVVRGRETARDLRRDINCLPYRELLSQSMPQCLALKKFGDRVRRTIGECEVEDCEDVRMRQRRDGLRFPLESRASIRIGRDAWRQHFDRDVATESRVARPIDLAHSSRANDAQDFVGTQSSATFQGHENAATSYRDDPG